MNHPSRFGLLLVLCAACSGVIEDGAGPQHSGGAGGTGTVGASSTGATGSVSSATGSTSATSAIGTTGSAGSTGSVGAGQGGAGSGTGGSTGTGGAPSLDASADLADGRVPNSTDANDGAAPRDASPGVDVVFRDDAAFGEGGFEGGVVGPIVAPECAGDPTEGWTEYTDTFKLQRPYDLMDSDRYNFVDGIHTFWVFPNDKPFEVGNTTAPRTEARYPNFTTGQRMWSGDILVDSPSNSVTIFQIHHTTTGAGPVYLQVNGGTLRELNGQLVLSGMLDKWFNLKVAFEAATATATIYVNNCQKLILRNSRPGDRVFYFKHGTYTCTSSVCRDHYKNIHQYQR